MWSLGAAVAFVVLLAHGGLAVDYTYDSKDSWDEEFPSYCSGSRQSPINIQRTETEWHVTNFLAPFKFENYGVTPRAQYVANNFHTLAVTFDYDAMPTISGGGLSGEYELLNMHFHWGSDEVQGSEHTIDTIKYPLELHIVHAKKGLSVEEVFDTPDGLAVLGILFEISTQDNPALERVFNSAERVIIGDTSSEVPGPYAISSLLPNDLRRYYRYEGSLTTPVCNEAVIWTVFKEPMPVSIAQLNKLRRLYDNYGNRIVNNYRNPQPLNGRTVYRSWL